MEQIRQRVEKIKQKQKGFTLVELIVVIAIIGILAAIMLPKYFSFTDDARQSAAISEAKSIRSIGESLYAKNGKWPDINDGKDGLDGDPSSTTFNGTITAGTTYSINGDFSYKSDNGKYAHSDTNGVVSEGQ